MNKILEGVLSAAVGVIITVVYLYDRHISLDNVSVGEIHVSVKIPGRCYYYLMGHEHSLFGTELGFYDSCGKYKIGDVLKIK